MPTKSLPAARIFSPRWTREALLRQLTAGTDVLAQVLPLRRVVLFGSYARGRQTAASDVDLLVIYAGEERPDAYAVVRRTLGLRGLEPHLYTEEQYKSLQPTIDRMAADGVVLFPR